MSSTGKHNPGFTLIEVIVVIVIIAVLSGMAALSLAGRSASAALRASAGDLLRFAQYAHDDAVMRRSPCRLVIDVSRRRFFLEHIPEDTREPGVFEVVTRDTMRPRTLRRGVEFGVVWIEPAADAAPRPDGAAVVTFTPMGEADATLIELTDGEHRFTLRIAPATGRAEVTQGREEQMLSDRMDLDA